MPRGAPVIAPKLSRLPRAPYRAVSPPPSRESSPRRAGRDGLHLRDLLLERHAPEQVGDAGVDRADGFL